MGDIRETASPARVLVVGHSDQSLTPEFTKEVLEKTRYTKVFGSNATRASRQIAGVYDLPLGIPNDVSPTRIHRVQADPRLLTFAWRLARAPRPEDGPTLYANFYIRNNPGERGEAWRAAEQAEPSVLGAIKVSKWGRLRDLVQMRRCGIVVCPSGAGMDTHRFWECLSVGAIPVVLKNSHSARLAQQFSLPAITVDTWSDLLNHEYLASSWSGLTKRRWDYSPLSSKYWIDIISSHADPSNDG